MKSFKRLASAAAASLLLMFSLTGCGGGSSDTISVVSREDGSGTRSAFVELFDLEEKNDDGTKTDLTTANAEISNSTSVVLTTVEQNSGAIGYISMGSLNDSVKAVNIEGVAPTVENVLNGTYNVQRPFNIVVNDKTSEAARDFIDFILSKQGQAVVEEEGYIPIATDKDYSGTASGKITIAGSSSVTPVMEALKEAFVKLNPNAEIEVQQSDSTSGVNSVIEGIADIGMASRELKESEVASGVKGEVIALDGLAVIVNVDNSVDSLTRDQVKGIYDGSITQWSQITE